MNETAALTGNHKIWLRVWFIRALKSERSGDNELLEEALEQCWKIQKTICEFTGREIPERPLSSSEVVPWLGTDLPASPGGPADKRGPEPPGEPDNPARVPRKPLPYAGAGEVTLPLPTKSEDTKL